MGLLTPSTQIAHVDGVWLETISVLRDCRTTSPGYLGT